MATGSPPKYLDVSRRIEQAIVARRWGAGRMPGLREIAAEYGVSVVTASRALHLLRDKGLVTSVNRSGHFLVEARGGPGNPVLAVPVRRWGLCLRSTPGPWRHASHSVTLAGFDAVSLASGETFAHDPVRFEDRGPGDDFGRQLEAAIEAGLAGIFLLPSRISEEEMRLEERFLRAAQEQEMPVVLIERNLRGDFRPMERDLVASDDLESGFQCTTHLIDQGKTRVAFVRAGPTSSHNDREAGYLLAMARAGLFKPMVVDDRVDLPGKEAHRLLANRVAELGADGVVCYQDTVAFGLTLEMLARRVRIPEDLAIVGHHDLPIWNSFSIGLTTYALDARGMAVEAVRLMERRLEDPDAPPIKVVVPGRLIVRESSARVSAEAAIS